MTRDELDWINDRKTPITYATGYPKTTDLNDEVEITQDCD